MKKINSDKTTSQWNIKFRSNENFNIPFHRSEVEPKIFCLFPEAKSDYETLQQQSKNWGVIYGTSLQRAM